MWEVRWIAKRHHHRARVAATVFAGRNPGFRFMSWPASVEGIPGYCFQRINAGQRPKIGTPRSPRQPTPQYLRINPGK